MSTPYYTDHDITVHVGDSRDVLASLDAGSVQCCVTSPPYYGLRDYGVDGQIGLEPSPSEYVAEMVRVFREVRRVLADDGVLWLNLGDSYSARADASAGMSSRRDRAHVLPPRTASSVPPKNLLGIPWRVAFALQDDGWILRSEVIWAKRNCMPESVDDRPSRSHEQVFLLSKKPRYWYDADAIREESDPEQQAHNERYAKVYEAHTARVATTGQPGNVNNAGIHSRPGRPGRNARSVWSISSQPFAGAHFATMPPNLVERCILAGCPEGGTVLDPFAGSGTTLMVARRLNRKSVGVELNPAYAQIITERIGQTPLDFGGAA